MKGYMRNCTKKIYVNTLVLITYCSYMYFAKFNKNKCTNKDH